MAQTATAETTRQIFLVDDHPLMRDGLARLIDRQPGLAVCGEASEPSEALEAMAALKPDLLLLEISLRDSSGIDLIKDARIRWPDLGVMVLSVHDEAFYAERVLRAGARGYVGKHEPPEKVLQGIQTVLAGGAFVSDEIASKMIGKLVGGRQGEYTFGVERLSDREFEVFEMIGGGVRTREIAAKLHLSTKTIDAHREHIKKKLGIGGATELLRYAVQWVHLEQRV